VLTLIFSKRCGGGVEEKYVLGVYFFGLSFSNSAFVFKDKAVDEKFKELNEARKKLTSISVKSTRGTLRTSNKTPSPLRPPLREQC